MVKIIHLINGAIKNVADHALRDLYDGIKRIERIEQRISGIRVYEQRSGKTFEKRKEYYTHATRIYERKRNAISALNPLERNVG